MEKEKFRLWNKENSLMVTLLCFELLLWFFKKVGNALLLSVEYVVRLHEIALSFAAY